MYKDHIDPFGSSAVLGASAQPIWECALCAECATLHSSSLDLCCTHGPAFLLISTPSVLGSSADFISMSFFPCC